jgi:hypothetical protein
MTFSINDKLRHKSKPDWGLGKVIELTSNGNLRVFFVNEGEKTFKPDLAMLEKVSESHPVLDNPNLAKRDAKKKYVSLGMAAKSFQREYPDGFYDEKYLLDERNYKVAAHELLDSSLNFDSYKALLDNADYGEICNRTKQVMSKLKEAPLLSTFELIKLGDSLKSDGNKELFSKNLFELLYGTSSIQSRFEAFSNCLNQMEAANWPLATIFQYLMFPDQYIFLKPEATKQAADLAEFELNYKPGINWLTYKCLQEFANYIKDELNDMGLKPRDMIDVQSFMWCISLA